MNVIKTLTAHLKSAFSRSKRTKSEAHPLTERVPLENCRHCDGTGDVMLLDLSGEATGQAFGECPCWKHNTK